MFFKIVKPTDIFRMTSQDLAALVTLSSAVPVFLVLPCFHSYHPPFCAKSKPAPSVKMMPQHAPACPSTFQADFACWHHLSKTHTPWEGLSSRPPAGQHASILQVVRSDTTSRRCGNKIQPAVSPKICGLGNSTELLNKLSDQLRRCQENHITHWFESLW